METHHHVHVLCRRTLARVSYFIFPTVTYCRVGIRVLVRAEMEAKLISSKPKNSLEKLKIDENRQI